MGWVTLSCKNQALLSEKCSLEYNLMDINQKLMSLQSYSMKITQGIMSGGKPSWLMPSGVISPYTMAKMQTDQFIKQNGFIDPKTGKYYLKNRKNQIATFSPQKIFVDYLDRASKNYLIQLKKYLHEVEKKMTLEKDQISIRLKMVQAEYDANKQAVTDSIKESAPKYA